MFGKENILKLGSCERFSYFREHVKEVQQRCQSHSKKIRKKDGQMALEYLTLMLTALNWKRKNLSGLYLRMKNFQLLTRFCVAFCFATFDAQTLLKTLSNASEKCT